ncbi:MULTISPECIES: CHAP domain-containing protein [unclassified Streptomyces]|uniref:aggregation-promoting factor C-terminal-like domain-containing protein n=1 Tax=unclassified Streptomyces TaxID=2593676 RepID=UPI0022AF275A|nr:MULTISPECIES: CHAP domain-containing protein [unclassified Streptomyces]MCZ4097310.1 CHAP domain-containing protein [Streptomyces sp. H39-C1]MCZ4120614.1 CHAP domain-containing protein [Streptomyces sp. H39-S7]
MAEDQGIPVARAKVPVVPTLDLSATRTMQEETVRAIGRTADEAGKAFERGFVPKVSAALEEMAAEAAEAGKASEAALKAAATRAAQAQVKAIQWVVETEGQATATIVRLAFQAADEKYNALKGLSARHKRILSTMGLDEESAVKTMVKASQLGELRKQEAFKATGFEYKAVLRQNNAALQASLREGLRDYKAAKTQEMQAERQVTMDYKAELTERLAQLRTQLTAATAAQEAAAVRQAGLLTTMGTGFRRGAQQLDHLGIQSAELATLLGRNVIAPLAIAGGLATTFGVKATDSFDKAANSLGGLGVSITATKVMLNDLQDFAINSSFSLADMNEFAPQYVRILTSHGTKPDTAAKQSEQLIKAIANNAAKGGITDPEKLSRAMQQIAYILDTDKLTLRNLKPFENATNMSMQQIATMLGYKDQSGTSVVPSKGQHYDKKYVEQTDKAHYSKDTKGNWKADEKGEFIKNSRGGYTKDAGHYEWVKNNGGKYVQNGFKDGKPNYVEDKGTPGKRKTASALLMADMTESKAPSGRKFVEEIINSGKGIDDSAKRAQTATISGRLQGMKEGMQRDLMGLFAQRDKNGKFEVARDPDTGMLTHVKTDLYMNVLKVLDGLKVLWVEVLPGMKVAAKSFVDGLNRVISIATSAVAFLKDHPALQGFMKTLISFSLKALPLLIAFGVAAKILGKVGSIASGLGGSAKILGKAVVGTAKGLGTAALGLSRSAKHLGAGVLSSRGGGSFTGGYRASRNRTRAAQADGWGWSNDLRESRDNTRRRMGQSRTDTLRGTARTAIQRGSGGRIDFDERDSRSRARDDYRRRDRALRRYRDRTPQTADNARDHLRTERDLRENRARYDQTRQSSRQRSREQYRSGRDAVDRSHDRGDISRSERDQLTRQLRGTHQQEGRERRQRSRNTASDHLPAVPRTQTEALNLNTSEAERAIKAVEDKLKLMDLEIKRINEVRLAHLQGEFDGSTPSVSFSAVKAREAIEHIKNLGIAALNSADLSPTRNNLSGAGAGSVESSAMKAESAVKAIKTQALEPVNGSSLARVQGELGGPTASLASSAGEAEGKIKGARSAITNLNVSASTASVRSQFDGAEGSLKASVQETKAAVTRLTTAIRGLKDISFYTVNGKFTGADSLKSRVLEVKDAVGLPSGRSGLNYALNKINSVSYGTAEKRLKSLEGKVNDVTKAVGLLAAALKSVDDATGGDSDKNGAGGGNKKSGGKKKAARSAAPLVRGFVDHGVHASFGGGSIGPSAGASASGGSAAAMSASPRAGFARMSALAAPRLGAPRSGGSGGGGGGISSLFGGLDELTKILDLSSLVRTATTAIGVDSATTGLGDTGKNVRAWVGDKTQWAGSKFSGLPDQLTNWVTQKLPPWLTEQPEGAPWSQLAGLAMGLVNPVVSSSFMENVYHGEGNVLGRAGRMTTDIFSLDTIGEVFSNLVELVKSLWSGAEELVKLNIQFLTNPTGVVEDLKDWATTTFGSFIGMFRDSWKLFTSFLSNPSQYGKEIIGDLLSGLKDALPNMKGLFDFSTGYANGGVVPGYSPGRDSVRTMLSPGEAVLRPEVVRMMGTGQIDGLNAAARGGNFKSLAEQIEAMWRTLIQPSFVSMSQEVTTDLSPTTEAFKVASVGAWSTIGTAVQTAWQSSAQPSMTAWSTQVRGDLTQSERAFLASHQLVWSQAAQQVDRSKQSSLASLAALGRGVGGLDGQFRSAGSSITGTWRSAMSYVDASTRSTVTGPYNRGAVSMTASMARLAGSAAPLQPLRFATGGVVPGYAPERDTVPAILSPGEGILRPEVVRALGADQIHTWNRTARRGGNAFAAGGIVQPIGWKGQSGSDWVTAHKADPYTGYADAITRGWSENLSGFTAGLRDAFGVMGGVGSGMFGSFRSNLLGWGRYLDEHVGGASAAVKAAQQELGYTESGPNSVKYNQFNGEEWCADFVSWVVDKAGANSSYWNSPQGTPANRWPSVSTWNAEAAGSRIDASQARAGDVVTFRNGGHIGMVESALGGVFHTIEGNTGPSVRRLVRAMSDPDHVFRPRGGGGQGVSFAGWPGAYTQGVDIPDAGGLDGGTPDRNKTVGRQLLRDRGWGSQFGALDAVWSRESGWNQLARNRDSGAYGIPQSLPASKMAAAGSDWLTNPVTQERWGLGYIKERYGDPAQAWDFWQRNHWYAKGTNSASPGLALVGEQGPELVAFRGGERVHTAQETSELLGGRAVNVTVNAAPDVPTEETILRAMDRAYMMHGL